MLTAGSTKLLVLLTNSISLYFGSLAFHDQTHKTLQPKADMETDDRTDEQQQPTETETAQTTTSEHGTEQKLTLAKELLNLNDASRKEQAVLLLIDASKQGNQEATDILAKCLDNREGITEENEDEVEWCVKTSEEEKRLRHAIEELYNSMKKEGKDKVALQDIDEALKKAEGKLKEKGNESQGDTDGVKKGHAGLISLLTNALTVGGQDEFSLKELMDTAMAYSKGEVPEVITGLSKEDTDKYKKASALEKLVKFPQQSLESLKHFILVKMSKRGTSLVRSMIPTSQLQMLFLLYIYSQLTTEFVVFLVPLIVFYIAFFSLVVFSLQMFYGREAFKQLKSVSQLMKKFDPRIDNKEAEREFMWKSVTPYVSFFIALLIIVAVFPLCDKLWIPSSELCLVALFFAVSSFRGLPDKYDDYALYTILLKILTAGLHSLENVQYLWFLCYPFLSVPLPHGLKLELSLPSLLHIVLLVMLVIMAGRHSWRGIYKILIPHLVCLLWWQLFTELFRFTSWSTLLRATVGWVIFITMLPMLFLFTIGLFLAYFLQWFIALGVALKLAVTALVIAVSSAVFYYSNFEIPHGKKLQEIKKPLMLVMGVVVICLLVPVVYVNFVPSSFGPGETLSWEDYSRSCGGKALGANYVNMAVAQIKCNEFYGESVNWTGTITGVKLSSVENRFRALVNVFPGFLRPTMKCLLGGEEHADKDRPPETSSWLPTPKGPCHLNTFDRYTFSVLVGMEPGHENSLLVRLTVTHRFYTLIWLRKGSEIRFQGRLDSGLGTHIVDVTAKRLYINGVKVKPRIGLGRDDVFEGLRDAGRFSAQFFMAPLVNQKKEEDED